MDLILIRHGRIEGTPMRPRDDSPLSELGEEQARLTAQHLAAEKPFSLLVCSPLLRARQTAQIIGDGLEMEPLVVDALKEMTDRELGWIVLAEVVDRMPLGRHRVALRLGDLMRNRLIGRVSSALSDMIEHHTDQRLLVIAHGGVIWGTLTHYFPEQRRQFSKERQVANCSITRVHISAHGAELVALNEIEHLGDTVTY